MAYGVGRIIKNSLDTSILDDQWCGSLGKITFKECQRSNFTNGPRWVKEFWNSEKKWDNAKIEDWFDEKSANCNKTVHISQSQ